LWVYSNFFANCGFIQKEEQTSMRNMVRNWRMFIQEFPLNINGTKNLMINKFPNIISGNSLPLFFLFCIIHMHAFTSLFTHIHFLALHHRHSLSAHRIPVTLRPSWGHHFASFEFLLLSSNLGHGVSALDLI
jgi:hypothetical protein